MVVVSADAGGAYVIARIVEIIVVAPVIAVHRTPFWEKAILFPPATQMRPFGEIAVLVCPYLIARTVPLVPKISLAPIPCDHVFPSMVYVMGDTVVVEPDVPPNPPATAMACCGGCWFAGVHVTPPSLEYTTGVVPFPVATNRLA